MFGNVITPEMHYDDWAQQYESDVKGWSYHAPDRVLENIKTFLRFQPGPVRLLDVGTGTGLLSRKCRALHDDLYICGLDISQKMLDICAQNRTADELRRVDVSKDRFPFEEASFDIVAASGLMENIENIRNTLSEMARVTRPGGLVCFTYMPTYKDAALERLSKKMRPGRTESGRLVMGDLHIFRHNPQGIKTVMNREGIAETAQESFIGYRTYVVMTVRYNLFAGCKKAQPEIQ